jgi:threonine dehydrogenase-like Zn-dependent dehydrogenase
VTWLLRRAGAGSIVAVDPFPRRRAAAEQLGADLTLAPEEATAERLTELSGGRGLDLAIEASGSPAALQAAIDAVAFQGTVLACAWYGAKSVTLELGSRFHRGRVRLVSSQVSSLDPALSPRWDRARRAESVTKLLPLLPWEALVSHRFPLSRARQAYQLLDEAPGETLQVVFTYGDD